MKRVMKGFVLLVLLIVVSGCSSVAKDHAAAVEKLFEVEEKSTKDSSEEKIKGSDVEASGLKETTTSSATTGPTVDEMREMLIEAGKISSTSTYHTDATIRSLFNASGLVYLDPDLWNAVVENASFDDLEGQIKEQYDEQREKDKDRKSYTYKITVQLPNIEKIKLKNIKVEEPKYDYDQLYSQYNYHDTYAEEVAAALQTGLRTHLSSDEKITLKKHGFTVTVTEKDDDKYTAAIKDEDLQTMKETLQNQETEYLTQSTELPVMEKAAIIKDIKASIDYETTTASLAPRITKVTETKKGDGYKVKLKYIDDLPNTLNKIRDTTNANSKKNNPNGVYSEISETTIKNNLTQQYSKQTFNYGETTEITVKKSGKSVMLDSKDKEHLQNTIKKEHERVTSEVKKYHDENILNKVQGRPGTGVMAGANSGNPIAISLPSNSKDYFVKFVTEAGDQVLTAYMRTGENLTVNLPAGNYKLRFASGEGSKWYGDKLAFGPNGSYSEGAEVITVQAGASYSLTLYGVSGGNLPIDSLNQGDF